MSYFNVEQQEHMRSLSAIDPSRRAWCGWFLVGKCEHPDPCPTDLTTADKLNMRHECCGTEPNLDNGRHGHNAGCNRAYREWFRDGFDLGGEA